MDERGLYHKFEVTRVDARDLPGEKHHGCTYFVLDIDHDPHAIAALDAYAQDCRDDRPLLAAWLDTVITASGFGKAGHCMKAAIVADELIERRAREDDE